VKLIYAAFVFTYFVIIDDVDFDRNGLTVRGCSYPITFQFTIFIADQILQKSRNE
jgi:hypothetical protein